MGLHCAVGNLPVAVSLGGCLGLSYGLLRVVDESVLWLSVWRIVSLRLLLLLGICSSLSLSFLFAMIRSHLLFVS